MRDEPGISLMRLPTLAIVCIASALAGCEMLGIESPEKVAAAKEAEGKAIGGACRHAGRAIEDCYVLNKRADKAAVFAGWREMNDYMRENKLDAVATQLAPNSVSVPKAPLEPAAAPEEKRPPKAAALKAKENKPHDS
jgi:hypothetical protein